MVPFPIMVPVNNRFDGFEYLVIYTLMVGGLWFRCLIECCFRKATVRNVVAAKNISIIILAACGEFFAGPKMCLSSVSPKCTGKDFVFAYFSENFDVVSYLENCTEDEDNLKLPGHHLQNPGKMVKTYIFSAIPKQFFLIYIWSIQHSFIITVDSNFTVWHARYSDAQ